MTDIARAGTYRIGDFTVNRVGYGAMQLAGPGVYGPPRDRDTAIEVLREAVASGVNHIDTSDYYGPFVVNELIREALSPYPEGLVLVTKVGARRGDDASWIPAHEPDELVSQVRDNLANLQLDAMDVVNIRFGGLMGPEPGSIARQVEALAGLQREGLVRHVGLSNVTLDQVREAQAITPIVCVQNHYNLVHRADDELVDALAEMAIAYVPFFPLGGFSPIQSEALSQVAGRIGATPLQVALAWLLHRSPNILLIPGTSSVAHLRENLAVAEIALDEATLAELEAIGRKSG